MSKWNAPRTRHRNRWMLGVAVVSTALLVWVAVVAASSVLQLESSASTLLALTLLLALALGVARARVVAASRRMHEGVDRLLKLADAVACDEAVGASALSDVDDEFRRIGMAVLRMRGSLDATLISRQRVSHLLDQIGTLRLELHADDGISHCSEALFDLLDAADTAAATQVLHAQFGFVRYRQLTQRGLLKDMDWQIKDAHGRAHPILLSGALLGEDRLLLIGNPQAHAAQPPDDGIVHSGLKGLILTDHAGTIEALNGTAEQLLGIPAAAACGETLASVCARQHCTRVVGTRDLAALVHVGDTIELTVKPDECPMEHHVQLRAYALETATSDAPGYALTLHDITWIRRSEARVHQLAFYDSLTGLANRAMLVMQLGRAIGAAARHGRQFALLFLDLDGFKDINDSLGHQAGDQLLQAVAARMRRLLRDADFAARLGGDEFCVLTGELAQAEDAGQLAARVLETLNRPYRLGNQILTPRASVGIGVYPDHGDNPEALLRAADTAMYEAKHRGKHQFAFYSDVMTERARRRMTLHAELHAAVQSRQFALVYQPQVDLKTGRMVAVEALIRWQHPRRGLLPPDEFIPAAERLGLMGTIDHWVMQTACSQMAAWHRAGMGALRLAVNIAPVHFQRHDFAQEVTGVLQQAGLEPGALEIEITERMARDVPAHTTTCAALARLGVRIAIDDFGVGYSSLSVLNGLPVHTLKIDQLFLGDVMDNPRTSLILGGIIAMAKGLALETVVEGVANREQLELVHGLGCHLAQGYFLDRPLPATQIPARVGTDYLARARAVAEAGAG